MKYVDIQKRLLKKTFAFNNNIWKSGLLDILSFMIFFVMLVIVVASFQYYVSAAQVYEQDYGQLMQDESFQDSFKMDIAAKYLDSLNDLIRVVIIAMALLLLLNFIVGSLVKTLQYKMLDKKSFKHIFKKYIHAVLIMARNTLPLFLGFWIIITALLLIFGVTTWIFIIMLILFLIYIFTLALLRISSIRNKDFKKSWKGLLNYFRESLYISPVVKLYGLISIIIIILLSYLSNITQSMILMVIFGIIQVVFLVLVFVYMRRYLFIVTKFVINKNKMLNKHNNKNIIDHSTKLNKQ